MEAFIVQMDEQEPPHYAFHCYMYTVIAAIVLLYWRVHRSECKRRTDLEQIFGSCTPARELRHTMLGGVHHTTDRQEPLHYAFHCYIYTVIAAIAILEGAQVGVQTTNAHGKNFIS